MREKYVVTFIAEFLVMISGILVYKLAAHFLGNVGFSEYALSRRVVSLVQPALIMGFGVGIPRYIAYSFRSSNKNPDFYFLSALFMLLMFVFPSLLMMYLFKEKMAFLVFGSADYAYLIFPICLMLLGILNHIVSYTYFQGKLSMVKANLLQIINIAIVPFVVFLIANNTEKILTLLGGLWCVNSFLALIFIFQKLQIPALSKNIFPYAKELWMYSIQRVPGDFGMAALLSIASIMCVHMASVKEAGYIAFGVSILSAGGSVFAPIGLVLLPQASQMIASTDLVTLRRYVKKILKTSLSLTLLGVIAFEIFADKLMTLYLGSSFLELSSIARLMAIGIVPYTIFVTMRSIIDSYYVRAVNTRNIIICLLFFLLAGALTVSFAASYKYLVIEFILALFLLGILTLIEIRQIFSQKKMDHIS